MCMLRSSGCPTSGGPARAAPGPAHAAHATCRVQPGALPPSAAPAVLLLRRRDVCNSGAAVEEKMARLGQLMDDSHASCRCGWAGRAAKRGAGPLSATAVPSCMSPPASDTPRKVPACPSMCPQGPVSVQQRGAGCAGAGGWCSWAAYGVRRPAAPPKMGICGCSPAPHDCPSLHRLPSRTPRRSTRRRVRSVRASRAPAGAAAPCRWCGRATWTASLSR